jgi:hypothetical protein
MYRGGSVDLFLSAPRYETPKNAIKKEGRGGGEGGRGRETRPYHALSPKRPEKNFQLFF